MNKESKLRLQREIANMCYELFAGDPDFKLVLHDAVVDGEAVSLALFLDTADGVLVPFGELRVQPTDGWLALLPSCK